MKSDDCGDCPNCRVNAAMQRLTEIMDPTDILQWFQTRNPHLDNQTPEALLFVDQHDRVVQEIERLVGGVSWQSQNTTDEAILAPPGTVVLPIARSELKEKFGFIGIPDERAEALVNALPGDMPILMALRLMD